MKMELPVKPVRPFLVLLLLVLVVNLPCPGQEDIPNSSKECAICHIRWVQAFDRTKPQDQRNPMQKVLERQAGNGDMCLSCHDGSVTDSRFKIWSTRHHTTDSVPSASVKIPTDVFPLDDQGQMTCATCHTAHAVPDSSDLRTVIFLRRPNVDSSLCLACHPQHAQKNDFQHPLGEVDYLIPQEIIGAGGKTSADGHSIICQTCHEPHGAENAWMLVLPPSKLCITCHTDKNPETDPPAGAPMHHIGQAYPGFEPPASLLEEKATFGPMGELSCLSCHRLHDASGARPLLIRKNENSSLCLDCHEKERAIFESRHDLRISSPETVNAEGQTALESGPCGACHRIHGWARSVPDANRPHSSGCMECHQSGGPGSRNRPYVDSHTVGTPMPEDMTTLLPLDESTKSIGCLTCHDPHTPRPLEVTNEMTETAMLSIEQQQTEHSQITVSPDTVDSKVQVPRSFLRHEGSQLCIFCHEKLTDLPGRPHDPATFDSSTRDALSLHPSIGPCRVCHTTHNARGPHLWTRTPVTDAGQIADLCGACHEDKLGVQNSVHDLNSAQWAQKLGFTSKGSCIDCHPIHDPNEEGDIWAFIKNEGNTSHSCETCHQAGAPGESIETAHMGKIIKSDIKLLPEEMEVGPDGRILCTTCHNIHQKEQNLKLLIEPVSDLCDTCHEDMLGIQNSIHDPSSAKWAQDLDFTSKGSCIDCHPIHGRSSRDSIWATIGSENVQQQTCENCHRDGAPGSAVETPHMGEILGGQENLPDKMKISQEKQILCTTCHNIHKNEQEAKLLVLPRQDSGICLACHRETKNLVYTLHDMRTSAPDARNMHGETASESGPCGSCHLVHREPETGGVWAQNPVFRDKYGSELCTCCHSQDQQAPAYIPEYTDHPDVIMVNRTGPGQSGYMPTFDSQGKPSKTGAISCLTCHEPHTATFGADAGEGLSLHNRMFLRPAASNGICVDCHGIETLWRFLYYHEKLRNPHL